MYAVTRWNGARPVNIEAVVARRVEGCAHHARKVVDVISALPGTPRSFSQTAAPHRRAISVHWVNTEVDVESPFQRLLLLGSVGRVRPASSRLDITPGTPAALLVPGIAPMASTAMAVAGTARASACRARSPNFSQASTTQAAVASWTSVPWASVRPAWQATTAATAGTRHQAVVWPARGAGSRLTRGSGTARAWTAGTLAPVHQDITALSAATAWVAFAHRALTLCR